MEARVPQQSEESTKGRKEERESNPHVDEERQARNVPPPRETSSDSESEPPKQRGR